MNKYYLVVLILINIKLIEANQQEEDHVKKLRTELLKNRGYDVMAIPVKNFSHTLNVDLQFNLINILSLDISTHILATEGWLIMIWHDQHMTWKPDDYGGVNSIRVTPDEIFLPDIMLYNRADYQTMRDNMIKTQLLVFSSGMVLWVPPITLKSLCNIDLTNWPYDEQECFLRFGSWSHNGLAINLTEGAQFLLSDYWENPEWDITYTNTTRRETYYSCCHEPYPDVTFTLRLKRRTTLYHYTVFLPVTTAMILNLLIFWFQIRSNARIILSAISLLMLTMILLYLGTKLGFGSIGLPFAIRYISRTIITIGLTLIWTAIAYNLLNLKIKLPEMVNRVTAPAIHILYKINESDTINLTHEDEVPSRSRKTDSSFEVLVLIIDKIMFGIFFITIISLHL